MAVILLSLGLICYFFLSEGGLLDLIKSSRQFDPIWLCSAFLVHIMNMFLDAIVTLNFIRLRYKQFNMWDAVKVACVGSFFSAITPSSTGGQPMQVYLMAKKHIDVGYSTSAMLQKFLVFQIVSTLYSVLIIIFRFGFFVDSINNPVLWVFVSFGFVSQVLVTAGFLVISFSKRLTQKLLNFLSKILHMLKFVKEPDKKIASLEAQVDLFHESNRAFFKEKKLMVSSYILIGLQILCILSVPYFIYRGFSLNGTSAFDMICSQSFVQLASAMMPLPGATGAAELGFNVFFAASFGETVKSATLVWRIITYYGTILICAPFSYLTKDKDSEDALEKIEKIDKEIMDAEEQTQDAEQ